MKLELYIFKNTYLGCTTQPIFADKDPERFAKGEERFLLTGEPEKVFPHETLVLYHVGEYDDETMKFKLLDEPVLLLRCSDVISARCLKDKQIGYAYKLYKGIQEEGDSDGSSK